MFEYTNNIGRIGLISLIGLALALPFTAAALGVTVTPSELKIQATAGVESVARMKVANPSKDVALFEVYPDDLETIISAVPASFILQSGEEKEVQVKVNAPKSGQFLTTLSVVGRLMADNTFQAGSGVKIPVTITVEDGPNGLASVFSTLSAGPWLGIIALLILGGWIGWKVQSRFRLRTLK